MNIYYALLDWVHLLANVTWIGGIIFYIVVLMPSFSVLDPPHMGKLMGAIVKRYAPLTWGAILLLIVTGILMNIERGGAIISLGTTYGILFFIKHIFVLIMVINGILISFVLGPKLQPKAPDAGNIAAAPAGPPSESVIKTQRIMGLLGMINLYAGMAVLLLTALARA